MNCPNCGVENPVGYRFCNKCGSPLQEASPSGQPQEKKVKIRICSKCGKMSPSYAWHCYACGESLSIEEIREVDASEVNYPENVFATRDTDHSAMSAPIRQHANYEVGREFTSQTEPTTGYGALRGIASLCRTLSNIVAGIAGFGAFLCLFIIGDNVALGLGGIFLCAFIGGLSYVILRIIAEGVSVILDIEVNTHQAAVKTQAIEGLLTRLISRGETK